MSAEAARRRIPGGRDFALFWGGQAVSDLGTSMSTVVLPLVAVVALHASTFVVAVLAAVEWLPWVLIGLPAGAWVDRARARPILVGTDLVRAAAVGSVPVTAALGVLGIGQLLAVAAVVGFATVLFQVAYQTYLPRLVDRSDLTAANALLQGSQAGTQVAGPGVGGLLVRLVQAPFALTLDAASYLVSSISLLAIRRVEPHAVRSVRRRLLHDIAEGARFVLRDPLLRTLTIAPAIANFFLGGAQALLVVFLVRSVGLTSTTVGVLLAAVSVGSVTGAAVARPLARRTGSSTAVWLSAVVGAPAALLIPLTARGPGLAFFVAGGVILFATTLVYNVMVGSFRQAYCPPDLLGRVVASMRFVLFGTTPLGALAGGALASALGVRAALWVLFAGNLAQVAVLVASPLRTMRELPSRPVPAVAAT